MQQGWNSYVKIPSKQFDFLYIGCPLSPIFLSLFPLYSEYSGDKNKEGQGAKATKKYSTYNSTIVNPGVWSGLIDGEGSFSIIVDRNKTRKLGWRVQFKFQIGLHTGARS